MKTLFVSFLIVLGSTLFAQNIERKIIIVNGNFYFTTIDAEFQIGTLNTGKASEAIKTAKKLALPAGRNYSEPVNPFSWDIVDTSVYAINFLMHSQNDRNEAIKRFNVASLKEWGPTFTTMDMIMKSIELSPYTYNDPYLFITRRSNVLSNFYYDAVALNDSSYTMAISNNGELSIWNYNGKIWKHGEVQKFPVDGYFSLFTFNKKTYMILNSGVIYEISTSGISSVSKDCGSSLTNGFLVLNKDEKTVWFMKNNDLNQHTGLLELVKKKAVRIF